MSIGNLKDSGNQGNNMPWQWQVLKGLQAILDEVAEPLTCAEDSVTICSPTGGLDVNVHDALGNNITSTAVGADTGLDVNIIGGVALSVNLDALDDQVGIYGYTDVNDPNSVKAVKVDSSGAVAIQDGGNSITVDGGTGVSRTPTFLRPSTASPGTGTVAVGAFSASFASVGTANALVGGMVLKPGETLNFDAGAINNTLAAITYDVTTNGAELIIITLT
jgi:hypothetical protein